MPDEKPSPQTEDPQPEDYLHERQRDFHKQRTAVLRPRDEENTEKPDQPESGEKP